jgi:hypothetical protein
MSFRSSRLDSFPENRRKKVNSLTQWSKVSIFQRKKYYNIMSANIASMTDMWLCSEIRQGKLSVMVVTY